MADSSSSQQHVVDYKALADCSADVILQISRELQVVYVSPSVETVLGWTREEMRDRFDDLIPAEDRAWLLDRGMRLASGEIDSSRNTFRLYRSDGRTAWVESASHSLLTEDGRHNGFVVTLRDVTRQRELEQELEQLARRDALTGLANRRWFDETLAREWATCRREHKPLSLVMADIDHFKKLNDLASRQAGDACLTAIAEVFQETARRPADMVARYCGGQFALILPNTHPEGAQTFAAYLRHHVEDLEIRHPEGAGGKGIVSASFGVATVFWPEGDLSSPCAGREVLVRAAQDALTEAKNHGRNCCFSKAVDCDGTSHGDPVLIEEAGETEPA